MATNSQFLFFYVDELIKKHWVDWIEGPLAHVPATVHHHQRGFQEVLGDTRAGPRTRAGEAYKLGILTGRLVKPQAANAGFPRGWQSVISGQIPATKLGYYCYIIGKALRKNPNDPNLIEALDSLASILILHIGFKFDGRWYITALLFQFAYDQLTSSIERPLSNDELRYLSAAVINTLDSNEAMLLIGPYRTGQPIEKLRFDLGESTVRHFKIEELPNIVSNKTIGINEFNKTKAALFWANPTRGIYSRASRGQGASFLRELLRADRALVEKDQKNLISRTLDPISKNGPNAGVFSIADEAFSSHSRLYREWQQLEAILFDATNKAAEAIEFQNVSEIWILAQREIRKDENGTEIVIVKPAIVEVENREEISIAAQSDPSEEPSSAKKAGVGSGINSAASMGIQFPTEDEILKYLDLEMSVIEEAPPETAEPRRGSDSSMNRQVSKTDFGAKEARNRKLGEAGEGFIVEYEKRRLKAAGRSDLASLVAWVSKMIGDGLGYDIVSYDDEGNQIYLEVKTTTGGIATPFFVSSREVLVSEEIGEPYKLVRLFNFPKSPRFFILSGSLKVSLHLEPTSYRARV